MIWRYPVAVAFAAVACAAATGCGNSEPVTVVTDPALPTLRGIVYEDGVDYRTDAGAPDVTYRPAVRSDAVEVLVVVARRCATCAATSESARELAARADARVTVTLVVAGEPKDPGSMIVGGPLATFVEDRVAVVERPSGPFASLPLPTTYVVGPRGRPVLRVDGDLSRAGRRSRVETAVDAVLAETPLPRFAPWVTKALPGIATLSAMTPPDRVRLRSPRGVARLIVGGSESAPGPGVVPRSWWVTPAPGSGDVQLVSPERVTHAAISEELLEASPVVSSGFVSERRHVMVGIARSDVTTVEWLGGDGGVLCTATAVKNVVACSWAADGDRTSAVTSRVRLSDGRLITR